VRPDATARKMMTVDVLSMCCSTSVAMWLSYARATRHTEPPVDFGNARETSVPRGAGWLMTFAVGSFPTGGALACAELAASAIPTPATTIKAILFMTFL
jgi:hypothetical protein